MDGEICLSHIKCPLCGKNAPLSSFNPSGLDLDLRLVSFIGLGRGKGFAVSEEYSVLGDEDFSPVVAERTLSLCRMFVDEGIINPEHVMDKLKLKPQSINPAQSTTLTQPKISYLPSTSSSAEIAKMRETIEVQQKDLILERIIDRKLLKFIRYYPYVDINEADVPWTISLNDIDEECLPILITLFGGLNLDVQKELLNRLNTDHPIIQTFLETLMKRPEKIISERMLEVDPIWVFNKLDLGAQEHLSKESYSDDTTAKTLTEAPPKKREKILSERMLDDLR